MFRSIADGVRDHSAGAGEGDSAEAVRQAFAGLLLELSDAMTAYGELVRAEVADNTSEAEAAAGAALDVLREARVRVIELRLAEHPEHLVTWELNEALLQAVDRILAELDIAEQTARRGRTPKLSKADPRSVIRAAHKGFRSGTEQLGDHRTDL